MKCKTVSKHKKGAKRGAKGDTNSPGTRLYVKNEEVDVLYDGIWYPARIMFKHRKPKTGYKVHYFDREGNEQEEVPADRIRAKAADRYDGNVR